MAIKEKKKKKNNRGILIDSKLFAEEFTNFRINEGLSIYAACKHIGISYPIYRNILMGKKIDTRTIKKMREFIEIKVK